MPEILKYRPTPKAIALILAVVFIVGLSIAPAQEVWRQAKEADELEKQLDAIRQDNKKLKDEIERLNTDAYIEQQARARLGLIKPGEKAYVIVPPKQVKGPPPEKPVTKPKPKPPKPKSLWEKIAGFLKDIW